MVMILGKFEVEDFAKWKAGFVATEGVRKSVGVKTAQIFQGEGNPKLVLMITEWNSLEDAKKFYQSPEMKEILKKDGVKGVPEVAVLQKL